MMHWLLTFIAIYVFGGITFLPLALFGLWYSSSSVPKSAMARDEIHKQHTENESRKKGEPAGYRFLKATEIAEEKDLAVNTFYSGWITVTKEFYKFPQINADEFKPFTGSKSLESANEDQAHSNQSSNSSNGIFKIKKSKEIDDQDSEAFDSKKLKQIRKKNRFYGILKHGNLFLYSDEDQKDVQHVIVLGNYMVTIWPRSLKDRQLFTKKSAICLLKTDQWKRHFKTNKSANSHNEDPANAILQVLKDGDEETQPIKNSYFIYGDTNAEKEDWYFAFIRATTKLGYEPLNTFDDKLEPSIMAKTLHYQTADIIDLIQTLNATEGQLTTKWLNAIIGRLFLSVYKTEEFKTNLRERIENKLKKIRTPGFLDELQIDHIDVGHSAPFFTNPQLKSLSPEGDLEVVVNVLYQGKLTLEIATKFFLNLGSRFKQREFDVNLKISVNKLQGDVLIKIKPQPSNRIWYTFTKMPDIDLDIEPVLSSRALNYNLITGAIKNKFKDAIKSSLVYPFMDDLVFYQTPKEIFRGGIWDKSNILNEKKQDIDEDEKQNLQPPEVPIRSTASIPTTTVTASVHETHSSSAESRNDEKDVAPNVNSSEIKSVPIKVIPSDASINSKDSTTTGVSKHGDKELTTTKRTNVTGNDLESLTLAEESELSQTADQLKSTVVNSVSRFKQWYSKKSSNSQTAQPHNTIQKKHSRSFSNPKDPSYIPPEMISNRRKIAPRPDASEAHHFPPDYASPSSSYRPTSEAFMKLDRQRGNSQSSQFGSISSYDDAVHLSSPTSPEMFINEKFKPPAIQSGFDFASQNMHLSKSGSVAEIGGTGPGTVIGTVTSTSTETETETGAETYTASISHPVLQPSPLLSQLSKPNFEEDNESANSIPIHHSMRRRPPPPSTYPTKIEEDDTFKHQEILNDTHDENDENAIDATVENAEKAEAQLPPLPPR